ncbi:hypothetical protein F2Q70_00002188 [Brassica cretica]|uniref:Uncharacterized protein n=1 Tax=Brassica cretica TaxID=69181 RepID=A0A8S9IU95_BRACR|nr:hypothetical protein F2Q70_00002188 [Brassica cretica]
MPYQVRLPYLDAYRLKATQNPSQTSVCLKKTEKIREKLTVELDGYHKRVKRVPKDMPFEDAYHKYRLGSFFRESRETDKDIELLFNKVNLSIKAIDTAELLGLKMEPSKDSLTFVDNSQANSAGMIKNVKVDIGECIIPMDFHAVDIKSGKTSSLLFGRAFMATVGAFYPMEKKKSEELISCIEMFEDPGPIADSNRKPAIPESASVDIRIAASDDSQSSESIDMKPSASVETLQLSKQPETEKSKQVLRIECAAEEVLNPLPSNDGTVAAPSDAVARKSSDTVAEKSGVTVAVTL